MDLQIVVDGEGWSARRSGLEGLASLLNGREVFFAVMQVAPRVVQTRRGGGAWEAWPDLFERSTNPEFPNCWQVVAGVTLPT